jgi:primosomal protein N' (replication factor Y)
MSAHYQLKPSIVRVLLPKPFHAPFDYFVPKESFVELGHYVQVPFGKSLVWGVVWETNVLSTLPEHQIKEIRSISSLPPLSPAARKLLEWTARYTLAPLGSVLKMTISVPDTLKESEKDFLSNAKSLDIKPSLLNHDQNFSATALKEAVVKKEFQPFLLEGVTGSGKTEVYFEGIKEAYGKGRQSLILVPEISLSAAWVDRFIDRFGITPTIWHSDITPAKKKKAWRSIVNGEASVIVGARSALFLPYQNLGYIVVDEEHDHSYKQETGVVYHARDVAVMRAQLEQCPIVLSSATPSLETLYNVQQGKYKHLILPERHGASTLPSVTLVDMKKVKGDKVIKWISPPLKEAIQKTLDNNEQSLLFLNRRGYAPLLICHACGHHMECPNCSTWLVYHKASQIMQCHQCNYSHKLPSDCPECNHQGLSPCGPGVERIEEEIKTLFPNARLLIMTSDTLSSPKKTEASFKKIHGQEIDIIIGTQVMAKGHHFPFLTLVGVIDGDMSLGGGDLRAPEKTYQLLYQVGGRAGRQNLPGSVLIQTHTPEHPVMQAIQNYDHKRFLDLELESRSALKFPPFGKLAALIISGKDPSFLEKYVHEMARQIPHHEKVQVFGPAPAPLFKLHHWYRWRFLIKTEKEIGIQKVIKYWLDSLSIPSTLKITVDIDPYSFT